MFIKLGRFLALLSLLTLLAVETMPVWAGALASEGTSFQICTTDGIKTVFIDENGVTQEQEQTGEKEHCPLCILQSSQTATPLFDLFQTDFEIQKLASLNTEAESLFSQTINKSAPVRAPPALS